MEHPFPKSVSSSERCKRLFEVISPDDTVAVIINADPDAMASALALKRLFWRKVKKITIFHINTIKRADNLSLIRLLQIQQQHIKDLDAAEFTKWALLDSQPHHNEQLGKFLFDIIIDHHPLGQKSSASLVDIREEYGAASTILTEYLRAAKIKPSPRLATALFYGIKTDTDNFARPTTPSDINAFRYLYQFTNINIIKKIESSEMTKKTLFEFRTALENLMFVKDKAYIHMGKVNDPDILVILADFFLKMAEATWCIVSGIYGQKLIVIFRNAGFRLDAGRVAQRLFGKLGTAGGHKSAARAEIPIQEIKPGPDSGSESKQFVLGKIKSM
ncbi:MAG: DHH family phosphoesterase [Deltaproteobacteria bacterium]|nr:DHH family phosphoesterase [Deltaproteobacteria bacterium]